MGISTADKLIAGVCILFLALVFLSGCGGWRTGDMGDAYGLAISQHLKEKQAGGGTPSE